MFTNDTSDENKLIVNPIQNSPNRLAVYAINRCEDQVIGFEFVTRKYQSNPTCFGSAIVNLCIPVEILSPIELENAEFWATNDTCYKDWIIQKKLPSEIEVQRDIDDKVTGILVRFSNEESCCYPLNMAFRLYGFDNNNCKFLISTGLLIFR